MSELSGLNLNDIDYRNHSALITGKGDKRRHVPVAHHALEALQHRLKRREEIQIEDQYALFLSSRGKPISQRSVQLPMVKLSQRQSLPGKVHL